MAQGGGANYYASEHFGRGYPSLLILIISQKSVHKLLRKRLFKHAPRKFGLSFFTRCDFLLNVPFLRGPYPETVHHVGGFMHVSHTGCCDVAILKKMVRVALQIVELLRFKYG